MNNTLIFDHNTSYMSFFLPDTQEYVGFWYQDFMKGVELLESAETIVTFNGFNSDMPELERWYENETGKSLCLNADPIDMLMLVYGVASPQFSSHSPAS
ncbi:MAG: hypothetical protein OEY38_24390 [Gammaproteobacteria bacterium]|nr:hypothetical protein [Gammaproteobacteria bacterium]